MYIQVMDLAASTVALWLSLSASALLSPEGGSLGGFICAPPYPPACARLLTSASRKADLDACQNEVDAYANGMRAYRDCLGRRMGEALHEANDLLDAYRCRTRAEHCPGGAPR